MTRNGDPSFDDVNKGLFFILVVVSFILFLILPYYAIWTVGDSNKQDVIIRVVLTGVMLVIHCSSIIAIKHWLNKDSKHQVIRINIPDSHLEKEGVNNWILKNYRPNNPPKSLLMKDLTERPATPPPPKKRSNGPPKPPPMETKSAP